MNFGASIPRSGEDLVGGDHGVRDLVNRLALLGSYPARLWVAFTTPARDQQRTPAEIHYLDHAADEASRRA